jgi:hypothetical protein
MDAHNPETGEVYEAPAIYDYVISGEPGPLFDALAKAQGEIRNAAKDSQNPHFKSKYADLASVSDACRAALSKNGIAVVQVPHNDGRDIAVTTILGHSSGARISGKLKVQPAKWDAQGVGSVVTYLRRYGLAAMAGVASGDDDDGEAGRGNGGEPMGAPGGRARNKPAPETEATARARTLFKTLAGSIAACKDYAQLVEFYSSAATEDSLKFIAKEGGEDARKELDRRFNERRNFFTQTVLNAAE